MIGEKIEAEGRLSATGIRQMQPLECINPRCPKDPAYDTKQMHGSGLQCPLLQPRMPEDRVAPAQAALQDLSCCKTAAPEPVSVMPCICMQEYWVLRHDWRDILLGALHWDTCKLLSGCVNMIDSLLVAGDMPWPRPCQVNWSLKLNHSMHAHAVPHMRHVMHSAPSALHSLIIFMQ